MAEWMDSGAWTGEQEGVSSAFQRFRPSTRLWFERAFSCPTEVQERGWAAISADEHALLLAPTGSGKTLAAFLWAIDRLTVPRAPDAPKGVRVLYVSPLKALVYDVERNLRAPLAGVCRAAEELGELPPDLHVSVRTGDTSQRDRRRLKTHPGDILVTTPESLYLLLTSQAREVLRTVQTVIVDEIHAVAGTKRGVHLALSLERLSALCRGTAEAPGLDPQRIGLSATQRPLSVIAGFLGGDRPVTIVDASAPPAFDLEIVVPMEDLDRPPQPEPEPSLAEADLLSTGVHPVSSPGMDRAGVWPTIQPKILDLIEAHRTTIVFTNSRRLCERLSQRLNELAAQRGHTAPVCRAHHGSVSHRQRTEVEEALKRGHLPAIVCTSSLELGIDMGTVDLVVQVASPHSVASGLQRVGRAGHGVGQLSKARVFPKFKGDLLEAAVVARGMRAGDVEPTAVPANPLDVLAQQVAAMCVVADRQFGELLAMVRRSAPYRELGEDSFVAVLEMLSGRLLPSAADPEVARGLEEVRPLLSWDRTEDVLRARPGARMSVVTNPGTIPDRGTYGVFVAPDGPRVGELDEEMVYESRKGDTFLLGASTWRIVEISRDRVLVVPAPGEPGRMPFWRGEGPGRPAEMGRAMGALVRELGERLPRPGALAVAVSGKEPDRVECAGAIEEPHADVVAWLRESCQLDTLAAGNLLRFVEEQRAATDALPTDRCIVVERFPDEFGDWRVCILSPFGGRVHAPWSLAIRAQLEVKLGAEVQCVWSDDGIVLRVPEGDELPELHELIPSPDEVDELVLQQLRNSAVFAARFREAAGRALLLPRRRPGQRTPLWLQRMRSQTLLAAASTLPSFPITLEAYRECLRDVFDLPALTALLGDVQRRRVRVVEVETETASPFARSLVFAFVANWLYEGDAPLAERRAMALSVDRALLRELLGDDALRDLIPLELVAELDDELQRRTEAGRAKHRDAVEDLLRKLGDLSDAELAARCEAGAPWSDWIAELRAQGRVVAVRIGGESRWIVPEDAARYRDGLGVVPPVGLPAELLDKSTRPLVFLVARHARTHAVFRASSVAARLGVGIATIERVLDELRARGVVVEGPGEAGSWSDRAVLRRLKRRALAALRGEVEPVDGPVLGSFLPQWHGAATRPARGGMNRLLEVLAQLEGCPLPWSELEARILPARVRGYSSQMLDGLGAAGEIAWIGAGSLGSRDGKVRLVRRDNLALLGGAADESVFDLREDDLHRAVLEHLSQRGASFAAEIHRHFRDRADSETLDAIVWDLAWAGWLSNDTFQPLRALAGGKKKRAARARISRGIPGRGWGRRGTSSSRLAGGRWWCTTSWLHDPAVDDTQRLHARAVSLLERHGVVGREFALAEGMVGGFAALYPVLREMENLGQVRRGWFVTGLGGGQFALPGAVDRLRAARELDEVVVLAATDPASPYGAVVPFPEGELGQLRRESGATVVLVGGHLVLYIGKGQARLAAVAHPSEPAAAWKRAVAALSHSRSRARQGSLRFAQLNGAEPADGPLVQALVAAGIAWDGRALSLEVAP